MGAWASDSATHVATMDANDFRSNEKSVTIAEATSAKIEFTAACGEVTVLKDSIALLAGEIIDATHISKDALVDFLAKEIADAKAKGILFSLHMKATMMKVSDPIIFGHCVKVFFKDLIDSIMGSVTSLLSSTHFLLIRKLQLKQIFRQLTITAQTSLWLILIKESLTYTSLQM